MVVADLDYCGTETECGTVEAALGHIEGLLNEADAGGRREPPEHFRPMEPVRILR